MGYQKSLWELPAFFGHEAVNISNHQNKERFTIGSETLQLQTVGIGQEFVVNVHDDEMLDRALMNYLKEVIQVGTAT